MSGAVSSARWYQRRPRRANTYAAPRPAFSPNAPAMTVDPERPTETPKRPPAAASEAVSSARWYQRLPERWNTYTTPRVECLTSTPTRMVEPETATETPKLSPDT